MRDTALIWITASNGIIYDLEYKAPNTYDDIYFTIRIESLALYGVGAPNGAGSGIYIRYKTSSNVVLSLNAVSSIMLNLDHLHLSK